MILAFRLLTSPFRWIISAARPKIHNTAEIIALMVTSLWTLYSCRKKGKKLIINIIFKQILFTGYDGLKVISFVAFLIGATVLIIGSGITKAVGGGNIFAVLVKYVIVRELAALLTAIIIIARSGTAIATEIGNMEINGEINALKASGINVRHFIVAPRIIGFVISTICMTTIFCFIGVFGGYFVAYMQLNINFFDYFKTIFVEVKSIDIFILILKSTFFGAIISTVSCYNGFQVQRSPTEVPIFSTKGVVTSINAVFFTYVYLTALSYM